MFMGHYGVSFAVHKAGRQIPLWLLFIAVQFLDVLWAVFVLAGIEKARIVPGITASLPLDLYSMPYSHSLVAAAAWSSAAGLGYAWAARSSQTRVGLPSALVGLAVFSHWLLDLVVHRPDLPFYDNVHKVGFGLWNDPVTALLLEALLFVGGLWLYLRSTTGATWGGKHGMFVFGAGVVGVHAVALFGPPPAGPRAAAVTFLCTYLILAGAVAWLEKKRTSRVRQVNGHGPSLRGLP